MICPRKHTALSPLKSDQLIKINDLIMENKVVFSCGAPILFPIDEALSSPDHCYTYPIFDDIIRVFPEAAMVSVVIRPQWHKRINPVEIEAVYDRMGFSQNVNSSPTNSCKDWKILWEKAMMSDSPKTLYLLDSQSGTIPGIAEEDGYSLICSNDITMLLSLKGKYSNTLLIEADFEHLPFGEQAQFDKVVITSNVLEQLNTPYKEWTRRVNKMIKKNGELVVYKTPSTQRNLIFSLKLNAIQDMFYGLFWPDRARYNLHVQSLTP